MAHYSLHGSDTWVHTPKNEKYNKILQLTKMNGKTLFIKLQFIFKNLNKIKNEKKTL